MNEGEADGISTVPPRRRIPHYHGDEVRVIFVIGAIVLVVAQSTGVDLPLSASGSVFTAILLVIVAGVTNPASRWVHWFNAVLAVLGALTFGTSAVARYHAGMSILDVSFIYVEALTFLSLVALYFITRTIRGIRQRPTLT